jgi:hypothetical protein
MKTPKTNNFELSKDSVNDELDSQHPLLPRTGWQDRQAFFKALVKAKRSLDIAEITALLSYSATRSGNRQQATGNRQQ